MSDPDGGAALDERGLSERIGAADAAGCASWLSASRGVDAVRVLARLSDDERERLLALLEPAEAADVLDSLPEPQAFEALEGLEPATAARIIEELPSDEQADLIGELEPAGAEAILEQLDVEEAEQVRRLAAYEDDQAGGLMITEFLVYRAGELVREVLADLNQRSDGDADALDEVRRVFVVDRRRRPLGLLPFRDLLLAPRGRAIDTIMQPLTASVADTTHIDDVVNTFRELDHVGLPVVDGRGRLVGVIELEDLEHALAEEADETYRATQGIVGGEELRSMPLGLRARRRLAWLSTNVLLNVLAACVIAAHQETLEAVIALAVFLPIISDMSGCSGNQAVAVSMREMALGVLRPADALGVLWKELGVGVVNGLVLGAMIGATAWLWKGNPWLGLVVGGALAVNTLVAVSIGGTVPLLLKRLGMDPALASGPVLTTLTDMCGFLLVLGSASLLLAELV